MSTINFHHIVDDLGISEGLYGLVRRIEEASAQVSATFKTWSTRSNDRRQLAQMSDRLLEDIGLTRSEIVPEINKYFWQK
ncbi:MAG: DUF1127 domain-containing protein [Gammaproteobacteria bacterium]|nr:DUF1127 domain-containing protein [Gammaproteobacteria bacterium]